MPFDPFDTTPHPAPDVARRIADEFGIPTALLSRVSFTNPGLTRFIDPGYARSVTPGGRLALWGDFDLTDWYTTAPHLFGAEPAAAIPVYDDAAEVLRRSGEGAQVRWLIELCGAGTWADPGNTSDSLLVTELYCLSTPLSDTTVRHVSDILNPTTFGLLTDFVNQPMPQYSCVATAWWAGIFNPVRDETTGVL